MNNICRLCLSIFNQEAYKLTEDCNLLRKIRSCLPLQIHLHKSLPNGVCKICIKKIEEIYEFHKMIVYNQKLLQKNLNSGLSILEELYSKLQNNIEIKDESIDIENRYDNLFKTEIPHCMTINNDSLQSLNEIKKENEGQESNINDSNMDSGSNDSLSLSMLKKKKTNITANMEIANDEVKNCQLTKTNVANSNLTGNGILFNPFTCLSCFEPLESKIDLIKHYHKEHKRYGEATKPKYVVNEDESMKYMCEFCNEMFETKKEIIKHMTVHLKPYICKICGRTYKSVSEIVRHSRAHNDFKLLCSYNCGFASAYRGALKEHEQRHLETPDYKYKCAECGKCFFVKTWYEQHLNIHKGLKPFVCEFCGRAFHIERYLTAHRSRVHEHTSNIKRYVCVHCSHPCDTTKRLAEHLKEHGINTEFLCDKCGKTFKDARKLSNHKYTHLQVKRFSCSMCNKSYAKKFSLKLHEVAHKGGREHACAHARCGKTYVQAASLRRHCKRSHGGLLEKLDCTIK